LIGEYHGGFEIIVCPELFIAAAPERTHHLRRDGRRLAALSRGQRRGGRQARHGML